MVRALAQEFIVAYTKSPCISQMNGTHLFEMDDLLSQNMALIWSLREGSCQAQAFRLQSGSTWTKLITSRLRIF